MVDRRPDGSGDPGLHLSTGAAGQQRAEPISDRFSTVARIALSPGPRRDRVSPLGRSAGPAGPSDRAPRAPPPPGGPAPGRPRPAWPGRWRPARTGPGWRRPPRWRRPSPPMPASSRLSWRADPSAEPAHADPDQPDAGRRVHRGQQLLGLPGDDRGGVGGLGPGGRPGDGVEVAEAHLEGDGATGQAVSAQPAAHRVGQADDLAIEGLVGVVVVGEGLLVTHRLERPDRLHGALVDAVGQGVEVAPGGRCPARR